MSKEGLLRVILYFGSGLILTFLGLYISGYGWTRQEMALASVGVLMALGGVILIIIGFIGGLVLRAQSGLKDSEIT